MVISKVMLHAGEEPFLVSSKNPFSGAIFFSGCNLKCVYCQNYEISGKIKGKIITPSELTEIFKMLEEKGAANIDLVTPTHFADKIIESLKIYKPKIPVIYNTSGFESVDTLKKLRPYIDIYLTDFKYCDDSLATKYSKCPGYYKKATEALICMKQNIGANVFKGEKLIRGIVLRHLVLPSNVKDSIKVLDKVHEILGEDALVSIMGQYTPNKNTKSFPEINRPITKLEYKTVISHAQKLGFKNILVQDLESASSEMIPDFNGEIICL